MLLTNRSVFCIGLIVRRAPVRLGNMEKTSKTIQSIFHQNNVYAYTAAMIKLEIGLMRIDQIIRPPFSPDLAFIDLEFAL